MEIIRYLGDILAKEINISTIAARGLLKLSIKDELGAFYDLKTMNYDDLCKVLRNSFRKRLIKLNFSTSDLITNKMLKELAQNQSLITLSGI